ncbi:M81 family metallopeptidase [Gehongia tenuis]|uniref:M81 family metallopeptidase n=1 Tax=Gehongia tenuis TaxID=2763655 RepID=A0A926D4Q5_9FIRM|nr:M81 family metallopeptidase [Gehongia tenuis]MBC8531313.1 M81 family metallopeptidase [Gehongia tenuis]
MKILAVYISHESNTFSPLTTVLSDYVIYEGEKMFPYMKGAYDVLKGAGCEIVPTLYMNAATSATNAREVYDYAAGKVEEVLQREKDFDGVWMHLHGACYVKEIGHLELGILRLIRKYVGPDIPIAWAMDPHGNVGPDHIELADILRAYRTVPHVDQERTDAEAARALVRRIALGNKVKPVYVRVPVLVAGEQSVDSQEPMISIFRKLEELDKREGILMSSYTVGFVWGDTPNSTAAVAITPETEADRALCEAEAEKLRDYVVEHRREFSFAVPAMDVNKTVEAALNSDAKPLYISDSGDNTTCGATGCTTILLEKFLHTDLKGKKVLIAAIYDEDATHEALKHEVGEKIVLGIGNEVDAFSKKIQVEATVKVKGDLIFRTGEIKGKTVTLSAGDLDIVLEDRVESFTHMAYFRSAGVDVNDYDIIVVKLGYLFPELAEHAEATIMCLTPGAGSQDVTQLPFTVIPRPAYPMDEL